MLALQRLCDRVSRMLSNLGRMKGEDNASFGYSSSDKLICDAIFNPIIMNPDFVVANFGMEDSATNSSVIFPAFVYQHKVVALAKLSVGKAFPKEIGIAADNNISNHITIMIRKIGIILENFLSYSHAIRLGVDLRSLLDYLLTV